MEKCDLRLEASVEKCAKEKSTVIGIIVTRILWVLNYGSAEIIQHQV
jgi:hypothetical protein